MSARARSALLWGAVGALAFLVLAQGYRLAIGPLAAGVPTVAGVAATVGALAAALSYVVEPRL